jgi:DNA-binding transcriptional LysR family regulator
MVHDHIKSGDLVELFPDSRVIASNIYAVYPERRNMPLKTRAFLDHLKSEFRNPPLWAQ